MRTGYNVLDKKFQSLPIAALIERGHWSIHEFYCIHKSINPTYNTGFSSQLSDSLVVILHLSFELTFHLKLAWWHEFFSLVG